MTVTAARGAAASARPADVTADLDVPSAFDAARERVVVGHDGSAQAAAALRWAVLDADSRGACVVVLRAFDVVDAWPHRPSNRPGVVPSLAELATAVSQALRAEVQQAVGRDLDVIVMHGPAAQALIDVSEVAQTVVIGADRRGPLTRVLVSSVAPRLLEGARCPVVVVPAETAGP